MTRKRFTERQTLACAIHQGATICCFRCGIAFDLVTVWTAEREHLDELSLGGEDTVENCAYSHKECHDRVTNGTKATTAGSSKNKLKKQNKRDREAAGIIKPKRKIPLRPMDKSRGFPPKGTRKMSSRSNFRREQ